MTIRRLRNAFAAGLALCFFAAMPLSAQAAPGDLDPSFGSGGHASTAIGAGDDTLWAMALQGDGKIVAAGYCNPVPDFCLARFNPDGNLDAAFGNDGSVVTPMASGDDTAYAVAVQSDRKIVAAGYCQVGEDTNFCLARYNPGGSLDQAFDRDGMVVTPIGSDRSAVTGLAIQSDDKIVAVGQCNSSVGNTDFCLARYNADGSLDSSFDGDGKAVTPIGTSADYAYPVAIQSDGKIVVAGWCNVDGVNQFCFARYNDDGTLDSSFDTDGRAIAPMTDIYNALTELAIQPDGKLVAAGFCTVGSFKPCLARLDTDGTLDESFDDDGRIFVPFDGRFEGLTIQANGKIVAAGWCDSAHGGSCLARYGTDGSPDLSFGPDGTVPAPVGETAGRPMASALQRDGKLVVAGSCADATDTNADFCVTRFLMGHGLSVTRDGGGFGRVVGTGIDCGADCEESVDGAEVTLIAYAGYGSSFAGWSGCDSAKAETCTVTMDAAKAVTATFTATPTFADLPPANPFYEQVEQLYELGVTTGCGTSALGARLYCPGASVSRQQMAAFLVRAKGLTQLLPATPSFADVPASSPFFGSIERLREQGITTGCGETLFCPDEFVSRQQMAAFLVRANGLSQLTPTTPTFADVPPSNPFYGYIERLHEQGITTGCGTNSAGQKLYCPTDDVPRQQMAAFLIRAFVP